MRSPRFAKAVFGSVEEPGDVLLVLGDDDDGDDEDDCDETRAVRSVRQEHSEDRKCGSGEDGRQRDVFCECEDYDENGESSESGERRKGEEDSEGGGDAFAAFEAQPDGVDVAEDGAEGGKGFSVLQWDGGEAGREGDAAGEPDGDESLADVEREGEHAEFFCAGADDVGRSDIAAALLANVLFEKETNEDEAEGN